MRIRFPNLWKGSGRFAEPAKPVVLRPQDFVWALGSFCALHRKAFDPTLLLKQFPEPHTPDTVIHAARALGFRIKRGNWMASALI